MTSYARELYELGLYVKILGINIYRTVLKREKKERYLIQSNDKSSYTIRKWKVLRQNKEATNKLRLHNDCGPT